MVQRRTKPDGVNRRQFITGAGAVVITGAVAALAACKPTGQEAEQEVQPEVPVSGLVVHDPAVCAGCGVCGLMCALYHHGEQGPVLSNIELDRDPFNAEYVFNVCQQCRSPGCYFACPLKDKALCIDEETGATYIDLDECDGCGECIAACPLEPKRIKLHPEREVSLVCDLCKGRDRGPICVEYCGMKALTYVPKEERGA